MPTLKILTSCSLGNTGDIIKRDNLSGRDQAFISKGLVELVKEEIIVPPVEIPKEAPSNPNLELDPSLDLPPINDNPVLVEYPTFPDPIDSNSQVSNPQQEE